MQKKRLSVSRKAKLFVALRDCIAAWQWKSFTNPTVVWCCHHNIRLEMVDNRGEAMNRIAAILLGKPEEEMLWRLNNFRPCTAITSREGMEAAKKWRTKKLDALHKKEVPGNTWRTFSVAEQKRRYEKGTIFPASYNG